MFICTWIIYFICFSPLISLSYCTLCQEGLLCSIHLYSVRSRGKLRGQINVISYVLNSILSQKTCSFSCNEACPSPPPPILSQVNLNLALLDLYSIPSDFCIILEWYSVYGPYGVFVFLCNAYSFISYRQGLCLLYIYCTKMDFLNIV